MEKIPMHIDARPYPYVLPKCPPALIVIDMQRDFVELGGFGDALGNEVSRLQACVPVIARLLEVARRLGLLVIHTREAHRPDLSDCPPAKRLRGDCQLKIGDVGPMGRLLVDGEPGNVIIETLSPVAGEIELTKPGKGAFYATSLHDILQEHGVTHLLITGVTTEVCVQTTMREANDRGYECLLVEDGTESYFPEFKRATLDMITAQGGIVGWVAGSDRVIAALEQAYGPTAEPPSGLVLADIGSIPQRQHEFVWEPLRLGVEICPLYRNGQGQTKLALLRYAPGASVAEHLHMGMEYIQVLAGAQQDERGRYPTGTLLVSPPGSRHTVASLEGCVVLAYWEHPVHFI
jgi:nicotinamidase-related amidase/quercetin dioxygenase-like cupin family protein